MSWFPRIERQGRENCGLPSRLPAPKSLPAKAFLPAFNPWVTLPVVAACHYLRGPCAVAAETSYKLLIKLEGVVRIVQEQAPRAEKHWSRRNILQG